MQTYKHGTHLKARQDFRFTNPQTGRKVTIKAGDILWVSNPEYMQARDSYIMVTRKNQPMGFGWPMTAETVAIAFEVA